MMVWHHHQECHFCQTFLQKLLKTQELLLVLTKQFCHHLDTTGSKPLLFYLAVMLHSGVLAKR